MATPADLMSDKVNHVKHNGKVEGTEVLDANWKDKPKSKGRTRAGDKVEPPGSWTDDPERAAKDAAHREAMESKEPRGVTTITLPRLDIRTIEIRIVGVSELIVHAWSKKAKQQMLDKQMGVASAGKQPKDPAEDYEQSMYRLPDGGHGFPAIAFKNSAVSACTSLGKSVTKVAARQCFHVVGEFVRIEGEPRMREDMVRIGMGTADIRYRAGYPEWSTTVRVRYNARVLTAEQVCNLFNTAGFAVGVGEWRSERDGSFGQFCVELEKDAA